MGFFKKLKKLSLGGLVAQKLTGSKENSGSFALGVLDPKYDKPVENKFDPGARPGTSINGQSGVDQMPQRLGWTNNGRLYSNSPFNGANPSYYNQKPPTPPPQQAPPMSFGGGGGMAGGGAPPGSNPAMGMGPPLRIPSPGGTMPGAGAQAPQGGPLTTQQSAPNPQQMMQIAMLRNRGGGGGPF